MDSRKRVSKDTVFLIYLQPREVDQKTVSIGENAPEGSRTTDDEERAVGERKKNGKCLDNAHEKFLTSGE